MAATEVERLVTRLEATHASFERDMKRAQTAADRQLKKIDARVSQSSAGFSKFSKAAGGAIAGILTVGAARALTNSISGVIDKMDGIAKTADKIGLSTTALQELRFAAELSGVSIGTFDMAFQRFSRRAAEAAKGTGEAKAALKELGIELLGTDGKMRPIEDLFGEVAEAMAGVSGESDRVRLAMKLFDSEGVALVNMLADGAAGLEAMRQSARDLGLVMSDDLIRDAVKMKDELTKVYSAIGAQWDFVVLNFLTGLDRMFAFIPKDTEQTLAAKIEELRGVQDAIASDAAKKAFQDAAPKPGGILGLFSGGPSLADRRAPVLAKRQDELLAEIRILEDLRLAEEAVAAARAGLGTGSGGAAGGKATKAAETKRDAKEILEAVRGQAAALRLNLDLMDATAGEAAAIRAEQEAINKARAAGIELSETDLALLKLFSEDVGALVDLEAKRADEIAKTGDMLDETRRQVEQTADRLAGLFADGISGARDFKSILAEVLAMLAEMAIKSAFGLNGGGGGGGGIGSILGSVGSAIAGAFTGGGGGYTTPNVGPRASGGPVNAGAAYMVGERGRELFVPETAGRIVAGGGAGSAPAINVAISNNFALGVTPTVRAEIEAATPRIVAAAKAGVAEAAQRGGGYAKGLRG